MNMDKQNPFNYNCKFCDSSCSSKEDLRLHISTKHKEFKCSVCHEKFFNLGEIRLHIKEVHLVKWTCQICDKSFANEAQFKNHTKLHLNIESEETCNENDGEESPDLLLEEPGKSLTSTDVKKPEEIHKCIFCDFSTSNSDMLDYHIRGHATIDILQCNKCGICFDSKTQLDKHKTSHKKILYQCGVCDIKSPSKKFIIKHLNEKHLTSNKKRDDGYVKYGIYF